MLVSESQLDEANSYNTNTMSSPPRGSTKRKCDFDDDDGYDSESNVFVSDANSEGGADHEIRQSSESESESDDSSDVNADDDSSYREAQEPYPRFAFYDPRLTLVKKNLEKLAKEAEGIVKKHSCITQEVWTLRRNLKAVCHVPEGQTKVIGLIGNAGQGKSSLVNSLTDIPGLAKAEDLGEAVTWVATIYRRAFRGQKQRFAARLEYLGPKDIGKLLADAVKDWKVYRFELPENITPSEKDQFRNRADTALSIFRTVFCNHTGFEDDEAGHESLNRICRSNASPEWQVKFFAKEAQSLIEKSGSSDDMLQESFESDDKGEMHEWLDDHILEDTTREAPSLWPFVKEVTIGVKGSRVLKHWNIADLPGLSDSNQVRVNTTQRAINKCDSLWVFDQVGRITTNGIVENIAQRRGLALKGKLVAIGTKSAENLSENMVSSYRRKGIQIHGQQEWKAARIAITKELKGLESPGRQTFKLMEKIAQLKDQRQSIDDTWWAKVAQGRNAFITRELQRKCQPHMPIGVTLDVFCISNTHYMARKRGERQEKFTLSPDETGIPALRKYVLSSAAPHAFREIETFVDHQFTLSIRGLELWASCNLTKGREDLVKIIRKPQHAVEGSLEMTSEEIKEKCADFASKLNDHQLSFIQEAQMVFEKNLKDLKWNTMRAFIQRNGNYTTGTLSDSWNELFVAKVREVLQKNLWTPFAAFSLQQIEEVCRKLIATVSRIKEQLQREPAAYGIPLDAFYATIDGHVAGLRHAFDTKKGELDKALSSIVLNATIDGPDNYFARAMRPAYRQCQQDSGPGVRARWLNCLRLYINRSGSESPFYLMTEAIETAVNEAVDSCIGEIRTDVDDVFWEITSTWVAMMNRKSNTASEYPLRQDMTKFMSRALPELERIKSELKAIKEQYPA